MLSAWRLLFVIAISCSLPAAASAECIGSRNDVCALINSHREIFVGRILGPGSDALEWRMHVVRSYRGSATGDIVVQVWSGGDLPGLARLTIGESYLFYVSKTVEHGAVTRSTPMGCGTDWLPLSAVPREELEFLARLNSPLNDGRVFGRLVQTNRQPLPDIKILLDDGQKTFTGTTGRKPANRRQSAWERRWHHTVFIVDRDGKMVGEWPHLDKMFSQDSCGRGPHKIKMNPYDPDKHVWIIDDQQHVIWKFTYDGKLVMTLGTVGKGGRDGGTLFDRPTDIDWLRSTSATATAACAWRSSTRTASS